MKISKTPVLALPFLSFAIASLAIAASLSGGSNSDPMGDGQNDRHKNIPCTEKQSDIVRTNVQDMDDKLVVTMKMNGVITLEGGYREYYMWLDVNPAQRKGYRPYMPADAAWTNMYADYRIFISLNQGIPRLFLQSCERADCSKDVSTELPQGLTARFEGDSVIFNIDKALLPDLNTKTGFKIAYTTYYSTMFQQCEDDSPQWGRPAYDVREEDDEDHGGK